MIETDTPKGKLIAAALKLAETQPWSQISMLEIADAAGLSLDEVRKAFGSKSQILAGFMRAVDDAMLKRVSTKLAAGARRDALFEVIMSRLEILEPYKAALKSIAKSPQADPQLLMPYLNAQRWMLTAAGINADGASGLVRTGGLGSLYASVFRTWLGDDDPGLARTMAALDRRLRRGEGAIRTFDDTVGTVTRMATDLPNVMAETLGSIFKRRPGRTTTPPADQDSNTSGMV